MEIWRSVSDGWWRVKTEKGETVARLLGLATGAGVIASAVRWHDRSQFASAVISGVVIVLGNLLAWVHRTWWRAASATAAVWLFFSPALLPWQQRSLVLNQMAAGLVAIVCSFFPLWSVSADEGDLLPPLRHA